MTTERMAVSTHFADVLSISTAHLERYMFGGSVKVTRLATGHCRRPQPNLGKI